MKRRNKKILDLYKAGETLEEIGRQFAFTRSRAQQVVVSELKKDILKRFGLKKLTKDELVLLDSAVKEEIKEISVKRKEREEKKIKDKIELKMQKLPHQSSFLALSTYEKALGESPGTIKKYFPDIAKDLKQKHKKLWSWHYNKCRICGTVSVKHQSHGLCEKCYPKSDIFKEMQAASRIRNIDKWREKQKQYLKEYLKRPEVIAKKRRVHDLKNYGGNREKAMQRDEYKCTKCGITQEDSLQKFGKDLYVERIKKEKGNVLENLITACQECHNKKAMRIMHEALKK